MAEPMSAHPQNMNEFCRSLLSRMTLEEKVGQMVQVDLTWKQDIPQLLRAGRVGSLLTIKDARQINALQKIAVEESRLGIPLLVGNDAIHGYRTIFPIPLALSCTWEPGLVREVARVIAREASASGTTWNFAPMVDICRDARWGRIAEGAGEDPLLGSAFAAAWVEGFQAAPLPGGRPMAACVKHFAAYGGAEAGKDYNTVDMSERRLRQDYLPPYQAAINAGVQTIMTSFNELNGIPATANSYLLQEILRKEWGFTGIVLSDYDAIGELIFHGVAQDLREAALISIQAGVDIDMMGNAYPFHLVELVQAGAVPEAAIDAAAGRMLQLKAGLGLFDNPYVDETAIQNVLLHPDHLELALRAAEDACVLLKNDGGLLPLQPAGKTIALIGPLAEERQSLLGSWSFDGQAAETETLLECLQRSLPADCCLVHARGCEIEGGQDDLGQAVRVAQQADVVILAVGESDQMSGEAHSRAHLGLPGRQQELAEAVAATGKPMVGLIFTGRPLAIPWLAENVPAILLAWQGGTRSAEALARIVLGQATPSGKLTASFPRSEGQLPIYYAHKRTGRPFDATGTLQFNVAHKSIYLDESVLPLYPFGYGLSYTTFTYSDLVVETPLLRKDEDLAVSAKIHNRGSLAGREIVQCYVRDVTGSITRPVKELKGFQKVELEAGESSIVRFEIPAASLSFIGQEMKPMVEAGDFKIWIGPNCQEGLEGSFAITG